MAFIDGTVVNVALPAIQDALHASLVDLQWVVESYALLLSSLLLLGGSLGDLYGRRRIFLCGIVVFTAASIGCGFARDISQLIVARGIQGAGAALLVPESLALISASFPPSDRGAAIGMWSGFSAITTAVGPLVGGWLVERYSWRAAFFINAPIAAIVLVLVYWKVPESRATNEKGERGRLDIAGSVSVTLSLAALVLGLLESTPRGWTDPIEIALLAGAVILFAAFLFFESRAATPIVPLSLFRSPDFAGANALTFLLYAALRAMFFFFPLNLIQVQGYSPAQAGAAVLPMILLMFVLSRWSGSLVARFGSKRPLIVGPVIAGVGFALFTRPSIGGSYWTTFFPAVAVLGMGMALTVAPLTTTVMNAVDKEHAGTASGINNAIARVAALVAIAVFGLLMLSVYSHSFDAQLGRLRLPPDIRQQLRDQTSKLTAVDIPTELDPPTRQAVTDSVHASFVRGFRWVTWTACSLAWLSALCAWLFIL
jgi:EmrB/QacA subfamily drug resistance transporter